ncbi:hypothetical protein V5O48_015924, partial [Marasmius crinis-equi]
VVKRYAYALNPQIVGDQMRTSLRDFGRESVLTAGQVGSGLREGGGGLKSEGVASLGLSFD